MQPNISIADRIKRIPASPTIAITNKTNELKQQGIDIIGLGAGEPDFDTPDFIKEAAIKAINNGQTKYTAVDGTTDLKQAILKKFQKDNNLHYNLENILVSCGAKHSIFNLLQVLLQENDEAIIPTPYWVSYPPMVELADAKPVILETDSSSDFKITPEQLKNSINKNTKLIILNSPSNPSGKIYTREELVELAKILLSYPDVYILSDDIYEHIVWPGHKFYNILSACHDCSEISRDDYNNLFNRTIVINGVSKAYSMTGWRIGYAAGHAEIIKAMKKLQSQSTSNPCSIAQAASVAALSNPLAHDTIKLMVTEFKKRHDYVYDAINSTGLLSVLPAEGAFYSFIDCTKAIEAKGYKNDLDFCEALLEQANVALVAGSAFGCPNHARLSFATSMVNLEKAMSRIIDFLKS